MLFFIIAVLFMYIGRKLGWVLSKGVLYTAPTGTAIFACAVWGGLVASSIYALISWQHPGPIPKFIMGYALGAYVSIPNFGLVIESTIPQQAMPRQQLISGVPFLTYIVTSVTFAFWF